ncbi:hypothetical protein E9529_14630 [Blastococcus sp. KM273128]|uniref:hypothetical protein n=1 Tax=Blastococcus sp. KM273128 TaxID=2570314 RepID=UPI001F254DA4|nr:hypothetical protein [Blastococcus sp. KM273128]MCF6745483.1 hypothetical protein [Blastococcus sp. KM273128]
MSTAASFPPEPPPLPAPAAPLLPSRAWRQALWWRAVRWGRVLITTTFLGTALVGALVAPWQSTLLHGPALGVVLGGVAALATGGYPREPAPRRLVVHATAAGVLLVPFGAALPVLGSLGGLVALVVLVVGPLVAADQLAADPAVEIRDAVEAGAVLPALPTAELVDRWLVTDELLLRSGRHRARTAEVRARLLEELSRRDPDGVTAWLAAGGGSPRPHLRTDGDVAG